MRFEGIISIAVEIEAEDVEHALKILSENPFKCTCDHIGVWVKSENHDIYPVQRDN